MWVSPNHPNPPKPSAPPRDTGQRLATFPRQDGEELRVSLAEYNGHPYVALRVWAVGQDGQSWPVRGKGVSVRLREVAGLADALATIAERSAAARPPGPGRTPRAARPGRGPQPTPLPPPGAERPADEFDEFGPA